MPIDIMLAVLLGAVLHAGWNTLVKSGHDKLLDTVLLCASAALIALLTLPFLAMPDADSWPFIAGSAIVHVGYFGLVALAYRVSDLSFAYPLMRGTAPLLVALTSAALIGEAPAPVAWIGILMISAGVIALALRGGRKAGREATIFAFANAVVIAVYTFIDGVGARFSNAPVAYTLWVFLLASLPFLGWALTSRRDDFIRYAQRRWKLGLIGGACTVGSYILAVWAMTQAPIAAVAALRETSILFASALAALVLKERFGWARSLAAVSIAGGAIALRLG